MKKTLEFAGWLLLLAFAAAAHAEPVPIKEERLGAWHYLYPMEYYDGGDAKHHRSTVQPTAVAFRNAHESIAALRPGSLKIVELRAGVFTDLGFPEEWLPLSLAADHAGRLSVLAQFAEYAGRPNDAWKRRFVLQLGEQGWEQAVAIPYEDVDRIEFDSMDRLWALGAAPQVGFFHDGQWTTHAFSKDSKRKFLPMRIAKDDADGVVLYSLPEEFLSGNYSRLPGSLKYGAGKFIQQRATDRAWAAAERAKIARLNDDADLQRAQGYVARPVELNDGRTARSVVRAGGAIVVSFGNNGLAWADEAELKTEPALPAGEWEAIGEVSAPPTVDPAGNLWVGRGRTLIKIGREKTEEMAGELPMLVDDRTIDFDSLGRAWVSRWHASMRGPVVIAHEGRLLPYPNPMAALRAESGRYQAGRIFPFAVKAPDGMVVVVSGFFDDCTVIDAKGTHTFSADQINPMREVQPGHGYNPFRGSEPWYDAEGRIYIRVKGAAFRYDLGHARWVAEKEPGASVLPPLPEERGHVLGAFQSKIPQLGKREIIYDCLHFYEVAGGRRQQLDIGVNPLAAYPFWTGWYGSPGQNTPVVDPTGAIWVSPGGKYVAGHERRDWWVLHAAPDR